MSDHESLGGLLTRMRYVPMWELLSGRKLVVVTIIVRHFERIQRQLLVSVNWR